MQNAAKNKSLSPVSLAAVRVLLLLVVALCLAQTRVWGFAATHQPASVVFESVTPSSTGENYDGCPYDASDSLLADGRIATGVGNGVVLGDYYQPATGAQMLGQVLGQVALGFTPAGIAGDVRDATAALGEVSNNGLGWRTGAGVAMAGVAFIPGAGDAVKGVVKGIVNAFPTATVIRTLPTPAPKLPDVETKWVDLNVPDAAKGGVGPVLQGQAGVARAIGEYEAAGGQVLGREISLRAGGGLTRPDFYGQSAQGFREFIEVKNGTSAALNPNQARLFPIVQQSGAVPVGANAARAGLPPGVPIPPTHVRVITYP